MLPVGLRAERNPFGRGAVAEGDATATWTPGCAMILLTDRDLALLKFVTERGPVELQGESLFRAAYLEDQGLLAHVRVRRLLRRRYAWIVTPAGAALAAKTDTFP